MASTTFNQQELLHYARQLALPEVGEEGQAKLKNSKVLCIGAGGLGCPLLQYLASAGVGTLGIVDHDKVDKSNLQRQILFSSNDVGKSKVEVAKQKLQTINSHITINAYDTALTEENAFELISQYDYIADCSDNFTTGYIINDVCSILKKPNIYASIFQFEGQLSIFSSEHGPCYRCLFKEPPPPGLIPNCAEGGVLGVLPGLLGTLQASEIIKLIIGLGVPLIGKLLSINLLSMAFKTFTIQRDKECELCGKQLSFDKLSRNNVTCNIAPTKIQNISYEHLVELQENDSVFLLDVRQPWEHQLINIGGHLIPLDELPKKLNEIPQHKPIVVYCKAGYRSEQACEILISAGLDNCKNLSGGLLGINPESKSSAVNY